ncbi:hypothetical protein HY768_07265 [candidate division TA06 bacterium]|uniref:Membrane protein involved in aromatic hydrocarbon degradation n=1 Tax=candidate division TA06 bacterium TaxID=2250710 RepID=A0A933MKI6_UNCT6|nr:hypothetical protein [candidate division TA06 bacterium]
MRRVGLVLALLALVALPAMAQSEYMDYNIMGAGARAHGMGGAFIGLADDATAVSWNPAGIAQLDKMEASAVGLFNIKGYIYKYQDSDGPYDTTFTEKHIAPNFFSLALPMKVGGRNLVLAAAYQRQIDMGTSSSGQFDRESFIFDYYPSSSLYALGYLYSPSKYEDKVKGGVDAITPAVALQLNPNIYIGVAANIFVNGTTDEYKNTFSPNLWDDIAIRDIYDANWNYLATLKDTFDITGSESYNYETKYNGFGLNGGLLATSRKFNFGAKIQLPFTLKQKTTETYDIAYTWRWIGNPTNTRDTSSATTNKYEHTIKMPFSFGFGVAIKPTDNLTIAADFERRPYGKTNVYNDYMLYNLWSDETNHLSDTLLLKNCNQFRVGLEYIFIGSNAVFPVRLGFRTDPKTYTGFYDDGTDTSQVAGKVFTAGFGMKFGNLWFDLAYELGMTSIMDYSTVYYEENLSEKSHNVLASCVVHF